MLSNSSFVKITGSDTTIATTTFTDFQLTSKNGRGHLSGDSITANRIVISESGSYLCIGNISYGHNSTGYRYVRILLDGSEQARGVNLAIGSDIPTMVSVSTILFNIKAGQTIGVDGYQNSGSQLTMEGVGSYLLIIKLE